MSYVVITETADDKPRWKGMPSDYPLSCREFETEEEAKSAYPDKPVHTVWDYNKIAQFMHESYPAPKAQFDLPAVIVKKPWWSFLLFWRRN